jgi:hypothetical protein
MPAEAINSPRYHRFMVVSLQCAVCEQVPQIDSAKVTPSRSVWCVTVCDCVTSQDQYELIVSQVLCTGHFVTVMNVTLSPLK